jgi:hypothetical protein
MQIVEEQYVHILEKYARTLESNPCKVSELFAEDAYFYDGGMKIIGREKCYLCGRKEIHENFSRSEDKFEAVVNKVCVNGNAMRYDVSFRGMIFQAIGVATINQNGLIQSFVVECIDWRDQSQT